MQSGRPWNSLEGSNYSHGVLAADSALLPSPHEPPSGQQRHLRPPPSYLSTGAPRHWGRQLVCARGLGHCTSGFHTDKWRRCTGLL